MPTVNLTTFAPEDNWKILSLERHQDIFTHAKCSGHSVELTFGKDSTHFQQAKQAWSWINDHTSNYVVLVTDNAQCNVPDGDPTLRQPWYVTYVEFDQKQNRMVFTAKPVEWQHAFPDARLIASSSPLVKHAKRAAEDGLWKRIEIKEDPYIPIDHDFSDLQVQLGTAEDHLKVSCNPCNTAGRIEFMIDVVPWLIGHNGISGPHLEGTITISAHAVHAALAAELEVQAAIPKGINFNIGPGFVWPIPEAGIAFGKLVDIGLNLHLDFTGNVGAIDAALKATAGKISLLYAKRSMDALT